MRVQDKVIIVTGAGSGMGAAMATKLAEEGAIVIVNDKNALDGQQTTDTIIQSGNRSRFFCADMRKTDDVEALVRFTVERYGKIDVFINNAGWSHYLQPALDVSEEEFDECYITNVKSIYLSTIHVVPIFRKQGHGLFINVGSTAGVRASVGLSWYTGSKAAVIITSRSLAAELGPENIRVNVINPGFNPHTKLSETFAGGPLTEERLAPRLAMIPLRRFVTCDDVANTAVFLASDDASFLNGICIEVDGGRSI